MTAMTIEWHENNIKNLHRYASEVREKAERDIQESERLWDSALFYAKQIDEAKRRGKASFDADRFLHKRTAADE